MKLSDLKKIISEEVQKTLLSETKLMLEYEYYVDDEGYAHDDEGNVWYVGAPDFQTTYDLKGMPKQHRPKFGKSEYGEKVPDYAIPLGTTTDLLKAMEKAYDKTDNEKVQNFLDTSIEQYRKEGKLSDKQLSTLKTLLKKLDMGEEIKWVDRQGKLRK